MITQQPSHLLDARRCRSILVQSFPDLQLHTVRYFAEGWDYELWEVNDDLLFRFPKREECAEPLRKEARLLIDLAGTLSTPVPRPEYVSEGCDTFSLPFFGYRKLPGEPLAQADLSDEQREEIARQFGRFLTELHSFPADRAADLGVPTYSPEAWRDWYREFREKCDHAVLPLLSPDERSRVAEFWHSFLENDRYFQFKPALIHGDLGQDHALIDSKRPEITGVIDFGDAMVGDPALDVVGLRGSLQQSALNHYQLPVDGTFLERATYYWKFGPYHEVLFGFEIDDRQYVESGLEGIRLRVLTEA